MPKKTYTVSARLQVQSPLVCYMQEYMKDYNKIYRYAWQIYTSPTYEFATDSKFRTHLCERFGILGRTANSMIRDIKGTIKAYLELKKSELEQVESKIKKNEEKVKQLEVKINQIKPKITNNQATKQELEQYRAKKQRLYVQKNKLNQRKQQRNHLIYQIAHHRISLGFGSKSFFRKQYFLKENQYRSHLSWYHDYVKQRDKNVYYLGSNNEKQGNQLFQMRYDETSDNFTIQVRKDFGYDKEETYVVDKVNFKYQKEILKQQCRLYEEKERPPALSYRVHRKGKKWYLQVMFMIEYEEYKTTCYHGTGNKAKTEIEQVISQIVTKAKGKGKSIVIEELDFKKTKAQQTKGKSKKGKEYNRMLHQFDYSRYQTVLENGSHRKKVELIKVNPKNTSKIGKQKYRDRMKLSVHQAASYVIARRGQGYQDRFVS